MTVEKLHKIEPLVLFGGKLVTAYPMTREDYNTLRGWWSLPFDEDGKDEGFLLNSLTNAKPNTDFLDGYVSWVTKEQKEAEFRETLSFPFGMAIEALKLGHKVSRVGWNGKGMYLALFDPLKDNLQTLTVTCNEASVPKALHPFIVMSTVDNIYVPWLASQADMLSDDWGIVEFTVPKEPEISGEE